MVELNKLFTLIDRVEKLERQINLLQEKIDQTVKYIDFLTAENKRLQLDTKMLEEENKRLQEVLKDYNSLQFKTNTVKTKLKQLIKQISEVV
jgi:regulator of replication initiation timing